MGKSSLHFCDIVPVVPIPLRNRQWYSYLSEEPIPRGSLALVPFGPRTIRGVVLSCAEIPLTERPSSRFKYVKSVVRESFVTDTQIALAESVSSECLTPLGRTLEHFLPDIVRDRTRNVTPDTKARHALRLTRDESDAIATLLDPSDPKPFFLESDIATSLRILAGAKRSLGRRTQMLVLVPELIAVPFVERELRERFGSDRIATLSGTQSDGAYFAAWERIRSGDADIVIGTRQALFAPFSGLGLIAILEEAEIVGYKQWDMSPRYDTRRVATTLAGLHHSARLLVGSVEGLDTSLRERLGEVRILRVGDGMGTPPAAPVIMVDMRKERWKKNRSPFSEELRSAIAAVRNEGGQAVLIVSRGGSDSFSVCTVCKEVPRCPDCDRALRSTRDGGFRCPACAYKTTAFPRCSKCGSLEFRSVGAGTEKIEREATRLFGSASLLRIDEKTFRKADRERPYDEARFAGILIGTPSALNVGELPKATLVAIMDADNLLSFPDFQADERFLRIVARAAKIAGPQGRVFIQSFRPEREPLRNLSERSLDGLTDRVSRDREALRYPPFFRMFRIAFRDTDASVADRVASDAYDRFRTAARDLKSVRISPPMKPLVPKVRGKYERSILITVSREEAFPEALREELVGLKIPFVFDPDPLSIV